MINEGDPGLKSNVGNENPFRRQREILLATDIFVPKRLTTVESQFLKNGALSKLFTIESLAFVDGILIKCNMTYWEETGTYVDRKMSHKEPSTVLDQEKGVLLEELEKEGRIDERNPNIGLSERLENLPRKTNVSFEMIQQKYEKIVLDAVLKTGLEIDSDKIEKK